VGDGVMIAGYGQYATIISMTSLFSHPAVTVELYSTMSLPSHLSRTVICLMMTMTTMIRKRS